MRSSVQRPWLLLIAISACSSGGAEGTHDASTDVTPRDARHDAQHPADATADMGSSAEATSVAPVPTAVLVRLANWSPDAVGVDFCIAPHGTSLWSGPVLSGSLGVGALGTVTVVDAGIAVDAGAHAHDAGLPLDARVDAHDSGLDAARDAPAEGHPDAASDARPTADAHDDAAGDALDEGRPGLGVPFPRMSPYVSLTPGQYDVRVVAAHTGSCAAPLFGDTKDLPPFIAGAVVTLATVGDSNPEGSDPTLGVVSFADDATVPAGRALLRYINAVPSVIETTLGSGRIRTANFAPLVAAAQFGEVGADTDSGPVDANGYVTLDPVTHAVWSVVNANGGIAELVAVEGVSVAAGSLATVVTIGGESGPDQTDVGILLCVDHPPVNAGETAACTLLEGAGLTAPVCPGC